jgi:hypothetical protein
LLAGLEGQGYTVIEKGYTFLGRLRIVAENDQIHREIVVNPGTGEILRDYAIYLSDLRQSPKAQSASENSNHDNSVSVAQTLTGRATDAVPTGTAGVAVSALTPGSSTLGSASLEVVTPETGTDIPLEATILPMSPGVP